MTKYNAVRCSFVVLVLALYAIVFPVIALAQEPVTLKGVSGKYSIGRHIQILEDKDNSYSIKDVSSNEFSRKFQRSNSNIPNRGYTNSSYWLKFSLLIT